MISFEQAQAAARWWLEFVRNIIVVATLVFFGSISNSRLLEAFSFFSAWVLLLHLTFAVLNIFNLSHDYLQNRLGVKLPILVGVIAIFAMLIALSFMMLAFFSVFDGLAKLVGH